MSPRVGSAEIGRRRSPIQIVIGLLALPLSVIPFVAYGLFTPEGRILKDRLVVAVSPPRLPVLTAAQQAEVEAMAPRYQGKVMALVYHGVGSTSDAEGGFVVSPGRFAEHLATLRAAGLQAVTAAEVAAAFTGGAPLPDNAVMITFDDGRTDAMLFADPLLDQADMRATMFLISSATDRPNLYYAHWDRIERAARSGRWDIQAHTHDSHREERAEGGERLPVLTSLAPGESLSDYETRIRGDLDRNDRAIEDHTGRRPVAFAYPFGAYGADRTNDPRIQEVLRAEISRRYLASFHQDEQESVPLLDPGHPRTGLRRLEVEDWSGLDLLGRITAAAGARPVEPPPGPVDELVAPPRLGERPPTTSVMPGRVTSTTPWRASVPTAIGTASGVTRPSPTTTSTEPAPTTTTEPWAASGPPSTTTTGTERPTTTTTTTEPRPTTTTTSSSSTTSTTRPSGSSTTTTTDKPCRGKGGRPCDRR